MLTAPVPVMWGTIWVCATTTMAQASYPLWQKKGRGWRYCEWISIEREHGILYAYRTRVEIAIFNFLHLVGGRDNILKGVRAERGVTPEAIPHLRFSGFMQSLIGAMTNLVAARVAKRQVELSSEPWWILSSQAIWWLLYNSTGI